MKSNSDSDNPESYSSICFRHEALFRPLVLILALPMALFISYTCEIPAGHWFVKGVTEKRKECSSGSFILSPSIQFSLGIIVISGNRQHAYMTVAILGGGYREYIYIGRSGR